MIANPLLLAVLLLAPQAEPEPPELRLPEGARVRVSSFAGRGRVDGVLVRGDARSLTLALPGPGPRASAELNVPVSPTTRVELYEGRRRHTLLGVVVGALAFGALGATFEVDKATCNDPGSTTFCSRGEAVGGGALAGVLIGALVGLAVQRDRWSAPLLIGAERAAEERRVPSP